jgi:hypothetical protein
MPAFAGMTAERSDMILLERFEFSLNHHLKLGVTPAKAGVQL